MKKTPFTDVHVELGAKMHEFAGFNMPIEYTGIIDEHTTVCNAVGVFDVSHMGEFWINGPKALELIQKITSNDASNLKVGKIQYTSFINEKGGIIDDFLLYHMEEEKYMLVVNAGNIQKDWEWINKQNTMGAIVEDASERTALLALQGPKAVETLQKLTDTDLSNIPFYAFEYGTIAGVEHVIISNTGYTGAGGFELYFYPDHADTMWNALFEAGKEFGIKPAGLGARDTLRLEMGFNLYGNDMTEDTTPLEAGLGWITKFTEGNDFVGRDVLEKQKTEGVTRKLCAFTLCERGIPRNGYKVVNSNDEEIGEVTSGTMSPMMKVGIGMGYVKPEYAKVGTEIFIKVRNKNLKAEVVKPPFRK